MTIRLQLHLNGWQLCLSPWMRIVTLMDSLISGLELTTITVNGISFSVCLMRISITSTLQTVDTHSYWAARRDPFKHIWTSTSFVWPFLSDGYITDLHRSSADDQWGRKKEQITRSNEKVWGYTQSHRRTHMHKCLSLQRLGLMRPRFTLCPLC